MTDLTVSPSAIREGGPEDAARIAELQQGTFDQSWSTDSVRRLIVLPATLTLVAAAPDESIIGFLIGQRAADSAEVIALAVAAEHRRNGWARVLLDGFEAIVRAGGGRQILLDVAADNAAARTLYEHQAYRVIARRARYYAAGRPEPVDAVVMEKVLDASAS